MFKRSFCSTNRRNTNKTMVIYKKKVEKAIYICDDVRPYIQNTVETFNRNFFFLITEEQVLYSFRFNHSLHIQVNLLKNFLSRR